MSAAQMCTSEAEPPPKSSAEVQSNCTQCDAHLAVHRIIQGTSGLEYWTLRCTRCGHLHQDSVSISCSPPGV